MLKEFSIKDTPNVKVHGRTVKGASPLPLFWNHSGVEVNCDGSELWIDIEVDHGFHEPWIAVELNGALMSRRRPSQEVSTLTAAVRSVNPQIRTRVFL